MKMTFAVGVVLVSVFGLAYSYCNPGCRSNDCDYSNNCLYGCTPGYYGNTCYSCNSDYTKMNGICCPNACSKCSSDSYCTECYGGTYGPTCNLDCSKGCRDGLCDINGYCSCTQGYTGYKCMCFTGWYESNSYCRRCPDNCTSCSSSSNCDECVPGHFGQACELQCSVGCADADKKCSKVSGKCIYGCAAGFKGDSCNQCIDSKWGVFCNNSCPISCSRCSSNADCSVCEDGFYGSACETACSLGCAGNCVKDSGLCTPCKSGFSGDRCCEAHDRCTICSSDTECSQCTDKFYGPNCTYVCPENCKNSCNYSSGACFECIDSYYGLFCNKSCPNNCQSCDINGTCKICSPGFFGLQCTKSCPANCKHCDSPTACAECRNGYFGGLCENSCPENCAQCTSGTYCTDCNEGFSNDKCQDACGSNCQSCLINYRFSCTKCARGRYYNYWTYGTSVCYSECSSNCLLDLCDEKTGHCTEGCVRGYTGDKCECPENCRKGYCNSGKCYTGYCTNGYTGDMCSCKADADINECNKLVCDSCNNNTWYRKGNGCCRCSGTCKNSQCTNETTCSDGCIDGYYGNDCKEKCSQRDKSCLTCTDEGCTQCLTGFFPSVPKKQCAQCSKHCVHGKCSASNGTCSDGCLKGFWGNLCTEQCSPRCIDCARDTGGCKICEVGFYTSNCSATCSDNCLRSLDDAVCDIDSGRCRLGCNTEMKHGSFCDLVCNKTCKEGKCDWTTGKCSQGCVTNSYGEWCEFNCKETCLEKEGERRCNEYNGDCIFGCKDGYFGDMCDNECVSNCVNRTCVRANGTCSYGCLGGYEGPVCAKALNIEQVENTGVVAGSIAGSLVCIVLIAAIGVVCFVVRRRQKRSMQETDHSSEKHTHKNISMDTMETDTEIRRIVDTPNENPTYENHVILFKSLSNSSRTDNITISVEEIGETYVDEADKPEGETYYNSEAIKRRKVPVEELADYVAGRTKEYLVEEFKTIPQGLTKPYSYSKRPENLKRNRYRGIYPYDANRVKLLSGPTDYINASYIDGFKTQKEYIACLGPTETATDYFTTFWIMVWQESVEKIVMLTNLVENTKMKCEQYWPEVGSTEEYAEIMVVSVSEEQFEEYTVRTFLVSKGGEKRTIYHCHYTAWPDKGVPDDVTGLIDFRYKVLALKLSLDGPVIVHCSAGIGRTGTYIALDYLTQEGEETGSVDILSCFANLRAQRVFMIQAEEQYVFLHYALVHSLTLESKPIPSEKFRDFTKALDMDTLRRNFERLTFGSATDEEEENAVFKNRTYTDKNHPQADIPGERYRPKLHLGRTFGDLDYINAVFMDGFKHRNQFVVAQTPLAKTIEDFLTLLFQEHITCIVDMQPNTHMTHSMSEYLPVSGQKSKHGCFEMESLEIKSNQQFVSRRLRVTMTRQPAPEDRIIQHYQYTGWDHKMAVPPSPANFLGFVNEVEAKAKEEFDDAKILLHCISGAERSCLFIAVSVMVQRMANEQEVSPVNVLRHVRSRRSKAIPTQEQYLFCHQCVGAFLDSFDTYSNFSMRRD